MGIGVADCRGGDGRRGARSCGSSQAAADKDREAVRALLAKKVDVNAARADGATALMWAAHWDDLEMADLLLRAGAKVNAADDYGVTAAGARVRERQRGDGRAGCSRPAPNPNAAQKSGLTPLMIASRTGNAKVVKALIANGANVNATTGETNATALMWALAMGHSEIITRAHRRRRRRPDLDDQGLHAAHVRRPQRRHRRWPRLLIAEGRRRQRPRVGRHARAALRDPERSGPEFALFLLEQGADPNGAHGWRDRAAHRRRQRDDLARRLVAARRGGSSLGGVMYSGRLDQTRRLALVKALLARGADPNSRITDVGDVHELRRLSEEGRVRAVSPAERATCAARRRSGWRPTPRTAAARRRTSASRIASETGTDVLQALLAAGANLHLTTEDGTTPLMVAAGLGRATLHAT